MKETEPIILAAGKGSRLGLADRPKPMAVLAGRLILQYSLEAVFNMNFSNVVVVIGYEGEVIQSNFSYAGITFAEQKVLDGTAGALEAGLVAVNPKTKNILVLQGDDSAFFKRETLANLIERHERSEAQATMLLTNKFCLGTHEGQYLLRDGVRVVTRVGGQNLRPERGGFSTGVICFKRDFLSEFLPKVKSNKKGERGIPDLLELGLAEGKKIIAVILENSSEWFGINTPAELELAQDLMGDRR